jgi:hypothetical protein
MSQFLFFIANHIGREFSANIDSVFARYDHGLIVIAIHDRGIICYGTRNDLVMIIDDANVLEGRKKE